MTLVIPTRFGGSGRVAAFLLLFSLVLLSGCAPARDDSLAAAARRGWQTEPIAAGPFTLFSLHPAHWKPGAPLSIYIEGDGFAWVNRYQVSDNPTPRRAVALDLALADPAANVAYLARPCQYVTGPARHGCDPAYWTFARYAPDVVESTLAAITQIQRESGAAEIRLIGYSGGGTLALLVAARRPEGIGVVTVAGMVDLRAWERALDITPLAGSLDPVDFVPTLVNVPQIHIVGADDDVVPRVVTESYLAHFPPGQRPSLLLVPDQGHHRGWELRWPDLLRRVERE